MITHAAYHAAYPLPSMPAPLCIEYAVEPPIIESRTHRIAKRADSAPKLVTHADYVAALSKTEWRDTATLSAELDVSAPTVKQRMLGPKLSAITEVRRTGRGRYEWRLK